MTQFNQIPSSRATNLKNEPCYPTLLSVENTIELSKLKDSFLDKYDITTPSNGMVSFTLPAGKNILDFIVESQAVAQKLYSKHTVSPEALAAWSKDREFTSIATEKMRVVIDGIFPSSTRNSREEQVELLINLGLEMPSKAHLAAAHMAYLAKTNLNLFLRSYGDYKARASNGALDFGPQGLRDYEVADDLRSMYVGAAATMAIWRQ